MFKFHLIRSMRDIWGHIILIITPVFLIVFFDFINTTNVIQTSLYNPAIPLSSVLAIGFALTFQIYGASISFESLGVDFFSPMQHRLMSTPTEPRLIVISNLGTGILVSFVQTVVVLGFSVLILSAPLFEYPAIFALLLLSIVVNQLLGTCVLFLTRSIKTANIIMTLYGAVVPMTIGLYFPLPDNAFFTLTKSYLSPLALANTAIFGIIERNSTDILLGTLPLVVLAIVLFIGLKPLIRRASS